MALVLLVTRFDLLCFFFFNTYNANNCTKIAQNHMK